MDPVSLYYRDPHISVHYDSAQNYLLCVYWVKKSLSLPFSWQIVYLFQCLIKSLHISNSLIGSRKKLCWLRNQWYQTTVCGWQSLDLNQSFVIQIKELEANSPLRSRSLSKRKQTTYNAFVSLSVPEKGVMYISLQSFTWTPKKTTMYVFTH